MLLTRSVRNFLNLGCVVTCSVSGDAADIKMAEIGRVGAGDPVASTYFTSVFTFHNYFRLPGTGSSVHE